MPLLHIVYFFFFNDPATTEIYTLPLHDALPISDFMDLGSPVRPELGQPDQDRARVFVPEIERGVAGNNRLLSDRLAPPGQRSEEHTSELQSPCNLVCRPLLARKKRLQSAPACVL